MTLKYFEKVRAKRYKMHNKHKRRFGIICPVVPAKHFADIPEKGIENPKTAEDSNLITSAVEKNDFLKNVLTEIEIQQMVEHVHEKKVPEGEVLLEQGEYCVCLFITKSGKFQVTENGKASYTCENPTLFGEVAILHKTRAIQTVRALSEGVVWLLDCAKFKSLMVKSTIDRQDEIVSYLKKVPNLSIVPEDRLYFLADLFKVQFFPASTLIIREGDVIGNFYVLTAGTALVLKRGAHKLEKLSKASYFGDETLKKEKVSDVTVIANPPGTECLVLSRKEFAEHFVSFDELLRGKFDHDAAKFEYSTLDLINFNKVRTLGVGGFGRVELVRHAKEKDLMFALKCLKKHEIVGKSQIAQVFNEKNLQMSCDSHFIVKLYRTFKDNRYVYFLLEPCLGGDLWSLLRKQNRKCFDTDAAKFYAGCVIQAFGYLHGHDIIYRDLKPENVMVDSNGYLKLTDFGFARVCRPNEKAYSFVGTAEYVSPELIQNKPHDKGVDYWALGVFIFELLAGKSPFKNVEHNDLKTYKLILKGIDSVVFPVTISPRAKNLIKRLCRPLSVDRLGCLKNGVKDVEEHAWFSKLDWIKLRSLQLEPPIKIYLRSNTDTSYFDEFKDEKDDALDDYSSWDDEF